jgi:hypothetical protein
MRSAPQATSRPRRPGENGFKYRQQYGLVIVCKDEPTQQRLFARLVKAGHKPKVVCV